MGWLEDWLNDVEPVAAVTRQARPEIKSVTITIRQPRHDGDPGAVEVGFYSVSDGVLTMHDASGKPAGSHPLKGDAATFARALTRARWEQSGESAFNQPLDYKRLGVA
jgi:hypothetical protein